MSSSPDLVKDIKTILKENGWEADALSKLSVLNISDITLSFTAITRICYYFDKQKGSHQMTIVSKTFRGWK